MKTRAFSSAFNRKIHYRQIRYRPSGSGKTLILVHKAACLLRYNSKIRSNLFICLNNTQVNYILRLLAEKGAVSTGRRLSLAFFWVMRGNNWRTCRIPPTKWGRCSRRRDPYSEIAIIYMLKTPIQSGNPCRYFWKTHFPQKWILSRWAWRGQGIRFTLGTFE